MIAVWFSCGAASAVAAKVTIDKYGASQVRVVNTPVKEEDSDNLRFRRDVEAWLGVAIEVATNSKCPESSAAALWERDRYMSNPKGAECTRTLKKGARYEWERINKPEWHVLGFTADEADRHERFIRNERENVIPVLIDAGITKAECFKILSRAGISRPRVYDMGFPNANCIGCVKATSPTYWNLVREKFPDVFAERSRLSREIGCKLVRVKDVRIFLDELKPTDKGRKMKSWDCGVFCEEEEA